MKKLLALVLALVMTLGLATVGTNAAATKFGDDASIKYTEAAAVMSAIGVFDGDDSSNFRPTETLKRSEAAKIVAYLMLTKKTADGLVASGSRYNDVPANHWAAGYIEYLTSAGVLGGVGDGKFNPDGDISTVDFAKMLLVALGFDAKIENLVLSDYRINTVKLANEVKLFDGNNDVVATNAITRDEAALYSFNLIKAPLVEYDSKTTVNTKDGVNVTIGNGKAKKLTDDYATNGDQTILFAQDNGHYIVEFAERYYKDLKLETRDQAPGSNDQYGSDDLGRPIRKWTYKNVDLGEYVASGDLMATYNKKVTLKAMYDLLGKSTYDNLTSGRNDLYVYTDGVGGYVLPTVVGTYIDRNSTAKSNGTDNGMITEVYRNDDGDVRMVTYNVYVFKAAADYKESSGEIRVTKSGDTAISLENYTLKVEDFPEIKELKGDDYVLITAANLNGSSYKVKSIQKATMLTGEVSTYTTETDGVTMKDVTINGEKKEYSATALKTGVKLEGFAIGKNATVVLDTAGYIIAVDEAVVVTDYVLIRKWGNGASSLSTKAYADAVFTDGTTAEIKVKEAYTYVALAAVNGYSQAYKVGDRVTKAADIIKMSDNIDKNTDNTYRWYAYSKNSSGEYTLSAVNKNYTYSYAIYSDDATKDVLATQGDNVQFFGTTGVDSATSTLASASAKANDKTVMVLRDSKDDLYVYTGVKNLAKVTLPQVATVAAQKADAARVVSVNNANGFALAVFVEVNVKATISGSANDNLIYVRDYNKDVKTSEKTWYNYRTITIDGEEVAETADNRIVTDKKFYVANYASRNKDGNLTNFQTVDMDGKHDNLIGDTGRGYIEWSSGALNFKTTDHGSGSWAFTVDKDAKVMVVKLPSESSLMTDKGADYEVVTMTGTAKGVADETNGRYLSAYSFVARTTSNTSTIIKELYVTLGDPTASASWVASSGDNDMTSWLKSVAGTAGTYNADGNGQDVYITGTATIAAGATVNVNDAANVYISSTLTNNGTLNINCTGTLYITTYGGHVNNNGTMTLNGSAIDVGGYSLVNGSKATANLQADSINISGSLTDNGGTINMVGKNGSSNTVVTTNTIDSDVKPIINLTGSALNIKGSLTTTSSATLNMSNAKVKVDGSITNDAATTKDSTSSVSVTGSVNGSKSSALAAAQLVTLSVSGSTWSATGATVKSQATEKVYKVDSDTEVKDGYALTITGTNLGSSVNNYELASSASEYSVGRVEGDTTSEKIVHVNPTGYEKR